MRDVGYNCGYSTAYDELLAGDDIDVVNILVPSGLHSRLGIQAADTGKDVICTKPIDITLEAIEALGEEGERNKVRMAATHKLGNFTVYKRIKQAAESRKLGDLLYGNGFVPWYRTDEYYARGWQGTKALDGGGALTDQSVCATLTCSSRSWATRRAGAATPTPWRTTSRSR